METDFSPYITSADKRQFLHLSVVESLMRRRVQLLKQLSVAYNPLHIKELETITQFISALHRYTYTEDAFTSQNLDGVTYRGVTLEQFYGKYLMREERAALKPNSEVKP